MMTSYLFAIEITDKERQLSNLAHIKKYGVHIGRLLTCPLTPLDEKYY